MKNKKLNSARLLFTASCCFCGWRENQRALSAFYFTVILLHVSNPTPAFGFFTCRWDATGTLTSDRRQSKHTNQAYKSQHDQNCPTKRDKKAKWQSQNTYRAHKHKDPERLKNPEGTGQTTRPTGKDKIPDLRLQTATPSCFTSNSLKPPDVSQKSQSQRQKPAEETKKDQMPRKQNHRKQKDKYSEVCWWPPWWHHRGDVTL